MLPAVLEKDVWICWALDVLFSEDDHLPMAFKGGTSLSKVYEVIDRFSEDIDVTVTVESVPEIPASRNKRDELRERLEDKLKDHLENRVVPLLEDALTGYAEEPASCVLMPDAETIILDYPSCYVKQGAYIAERVKIEFGARNEITPNEPHAVVPYITEAFGDGDAPVLPVAAVDVLSATRTFWEKATLAHDECNRGALDRESAERISRHWYDLAKLSESEIGARALSQDLGLLHDVVRVKTAYYKRRTSHYEDCVTGGMRLVPDSSGLDALRSDYQVMIDSEMFRGEPPSFDWVMDKVRILESTINEAVPKDAAAPVS
jgi:hypothetical protein